MSARVKMLLTASLATLALPGAAHAQLCYGVEGRIITADTTLGTNVTAYMTAGTTALIAAYEAQSEIVISALKVGVAQSSLSSSQVGTSILQGTQAAASAEVSARVAQEVVQAGDEYLSTGYNSCLIESKSQGFYAAYNGAFAQGDPVLQLAPAQAAPGRITDPGPWFTSVNTGTANTAQSLYDGDTTKAAAYINLVLGPPDQYRSGSGQTVDGSIFLASKLNRDARRGAAQYVMSSIAEENAATGPKLALTALADAYIGDGGEAWAASMASSGVRGVLLDAVRLAAANVAADAYEVRKSMRTELAVAAYVLARTQAVTAPTGATTMSPTMAASR